MSKKWLSLLVAIIITALFIPSQSHSLAEEGIEKLHREAVVWDCHSDLVLRVLYEGLDIGNRLPVGHVDIPRLKEGQVDVQVMALFVQNFLYPDKCDEQALRLIKVMTDAIAKHSESAEIARTGKDIDRILKSGKIAMPLSIEGGHAIEDDIKNLQIFHSLGVSSMTITHNVSHGWADSSGDRKKWGGLNELGRGIIREMNRLGMVIDLSHVSDETFFDVLDITSDPVIFSHSGCRALNPHHRNVSDDMLRAVAKNGGVIGIVFVLPFLTEEYNKAMGRLSAISRPWMKKMPPIDDLEVRAAFEHLYLSADWPLENLPTLEDLLNHIDHAVKIAGIDHVGLGADFYPRTPAPVGIEGASDYAKITIGLKKRGYLDAEIRKILGGNFLRIWRAVTDRNISPKPRE